MKYLFLALLAICSLQTQARKNSVYVGVLAGSTGARITTDNAVVTRINGNGLSPALSFTTDINFDRGGNRLYFSIPVRLHTIYLRVREGYYAQLSYSMNTAFYSDFISAASFGAGVGLNYLPLLKKNISISTGIGVVPAIETGRFRGVSRVNATCEAHAGILMNNQIYIGARYTYFAMPYEVNQALPYERNQYGVSQIQFDLRFKIRK